MSKTILVLAGVLATVSASAEERAREFGPRVGTVDDYYWLGALLSLAYRF